MFLVTGGAVAGACGGDDEARPPKPVRDAGRDVATDAKTDVSVDAAPDRADTGAEADTGPSCAAPRRQCGAECVDVSANNRHCGGCGIDCGAVTVCNDGICVAPCGVDQARCLGQCVPLGTDNVNCGRCGERCAEGLVCSRGVCSLECGAPLGTCPSALPADAATAMDAASDAATDAARDGASDAARDAASDAGNAGDGAADGAPPAARYCADFQNDERNCGGCGVRCAPGQECVQGNCDTTCVVGQTLCGELCRDLSTDLAHCGRCNNECGAGEVCSGATCQASCGAPFVRCGSRCANVATDPENCGDCGRACQPQNAAQATCAAGRCGYGRCFEGFADCDGNPENGCELPVSADPSNCGFCGIRCQAANATGAQCKSGSCDYAACAAGFSDCDGIRANGCETFVAGDVNHCGICGKKCAVGELCNQSSCTGAVALSSFVFPGGIPGVVRRPRATQYTLATVTGATIHFTLNGSTPNPGSAGTFAGTTPLTLTAVDGTTEIRWFAQFPIGYSEAVRSMTHITDSASTINLGVIGERTRVNGGGPIALVVRGGAVSGSVDFTAWASTTGHCPTCILQYVIAVDQVGAAAGCVNLGVPPAFPGSSGTVNFTFTAPTQPGSYFIRGGLTTQFGCDGTIPGVTEAIGMIVTQ